MVSVGVFQNLPLGVLIARLLPKKKNRRRRRRRRFFWLFFLTIMRCFEFDFHSYHVFPLHYGELPNKDGQVWCTCQIVIVRSKFVLVRSANRTSCDCVWLSFRVLKPVVIVVIVISSTQSIKYCSYTIHKCVLYYTQVRRTCPSL